MVDIIEKLKENNTKEAYEYFLQIENQAAESDQWYPYFEKFLKFLCSDKSYVRVRGFRMCCAMAQWDTENKWDAHFAELLSILDDDKPTVVRQCLSALHQLLLFQPEFKDKLKKNSKVLIYHNINPR